LFSLEEMVKENLSICTPEALSAAYSKEMKEHENVFRNIIRDNGKKRQNYLNELKRAVERESEAAADNAKFAPYLQGAAYLEEINMNLDWAKTWIEQAEKMFKKVKDWDEKYVSKDFVEAHILWTKAKILARSGDYKEAAKLAQQVVDFKEGAQYYKRGSNKAKVDEKLNEWGEKSK
jgi:tetratricopeptide (TPR) repeat protein